MDLEPSWRMRTGITTYSYRWWVVPSANNVCDECGCQGKRACVGMFTPVSGRCDECSCDLGSSEEWRPYTARTAPAAQRHAQDSKAVASGLVRLAKGAAYGASAFMTGVQLGNLASQAAADGVIDPQEAVRIAVEATGGRVDNAVEILRSAVTSDPAPFGQEVINQGANSGFVDVLAEGVRCLFG